jgi:hypothetical protein
LIRSKSFLKAFRRCKKICLREEHLFSSGVFKVGTAFKFVGITEVMPVYERFEDGAEVGFRTISQHQYRRYSRRFLDEEDVQAADKPTKRPARKNRGSQ